jgi:hypothetical protein
MAIGSGRSNRLLGMWGYDTAMDAANRGQGLVDNARTDALAALGRGREAIGAGRNEGLAALGQGYDRARGDLNTQYTGAIDRLNPYAEAGLPALGAYQDSLGLNGQSGYDRSVATYRTGPGYERRVSEATDAAMRAASAGGMLGSGNTLAAVADRVQGIADQDYNRYQGQLQGLATLGQQAAGAQSGMQTQLGNSLASLGQGQGRDTASLWADSAGREASTYGTEAGLHGQLAGLGLSNLWNGTSAGIGAVTNAAQRASDSVNSGWSLGLNALGSGLNLLTGLSGYGARR